MLYAITLHYTRPKDEVEAHLDTHRQWLAAEIQAGRVLAAGTIEAGHGGLVLAYAADRDTIDAMVARDSFHVQGVATFEIAAFQPMVRSAAFPSEWACEARAIA